MGAPLDTSFSFFVLRSEMFIFKSTLYAHWRVQGVLPPKGPNSFIFAYFLLPKSAHVGGWHPPNGSVLTPTQREILDPPLTPKHYMYIQIK